MRACRWAIFLAALHLASTSGAEFESSASATRRTAHTTHGDGASNSLALGVLCKSVSGPGREECDHVLATVQALNNKTDGFFDHLLPHTQIQVAVAYVGCAESTSRVPAAMQELFSVLPRMRAVIGPSCSDDVQDVYTWLRAYDRWGSLVVMSPSSTAPRLVDESAYPYLARFAPNEIAYQAGVLKAMLHYGWKRVGVLADDSSQAQGTKLAFIAQLTAQCPHCRITNKGNTDFSIEDFRLGKLKARRLLERLNDANTKIVGCMLVAC